MTKARRAGSIWAGFVGRHCGRAKALFVALPLLMLSVLVDHGLASAPAPNPGNRINSHASDVAGTEGKAQLPSRGTVATVDPLRVKPKLSGGGTMGTLGHSPTARVHLPSPVSQVEPRHTHHAAPAQRRAAACPRAPPLQAA